MSHFSADFFSANRSRLRERLEGELPIILTGHGLLQRNHDTSFPFRQDSNFWYLTGVDEPDVLLVMDKGKEYLIAPLREGPRETFDGSVDVAELAARSGITEVLSYSAGWKRLKARLKKVAEIATFSPPQAYVEQLGIYTNPARNRLLDMLKAINPDVSFVDLRLELMDLRSVKQPPEIKAIQAAIDLTIDTLTSVTKQGIGNYDSECDLEAAISAGYRRGGAAHHAYQPIIASGKNACTLHYVQNSSQLNNGELVLIDTGAEIENYAADITRTYICGKATKRQQQVFQAVVDAHAYALSLLAPGVVIRKYEKQIEKYMGEKLRELGLIKTITSEAVRAYYPHATSHFLGLDVHDVGDYEAPLRPGMILTVEPGIYIPEESIGIRLEDDILITENGATNLSQRLPLSLA